MRRAIRLALPALLLVAAPASAQDPIEEVRDLYYAAVENESAIPAALAVIDSLRELSSPVLRAYEGAIITLRAKHGWWPPDRLRHLRGGLTILDEMVEDHPTQVEIRYLRLMSCFYLPGILGRSWSVAEDFDALARLLPDAGDDYPPDLYAAVVRFVLTNGDLTADQRAALERAMGSRILSHHSRTALRTFEHLPLLRRELWTDGAPNKVQEDQ